MNPFLSEKTRIEFKKAHKKEPHRRHADRIKAILLLDSGWSYEEVAEALLLDDQTIRNYEKLYKDKGFDGLLSDNYVGCMPKLTCEQEEQLKDHIRKNNYSAAKEIVEYVKQTFNKTYTPEGMVHTLDRLGFTYKKTTIVPGKANPEKQKEFIENYKQLKEEKAPGDKILFMDGVHPQHNSTFAYCWIEKGKKKEIPSNTGRKRINLNGAIDIETFEVTIREDESINAQSTIKLFHEIESRYAQAGTIYIISDNAKYYRSKLVKEYLANSRIKIKFLPSYSPNLNLIERLWKFFRKKILYNKYYDTYEKFKNKCLSFFKNINEYTDELSTLLTENFQIIGEQISKI
ncbi:IS630 family transposase [Candidatus Kuenenia sp.]|uniref:IS630 family transposase n=1 Tax=Candidatus Kuenenia sp. TaxID=2499824 RepID=UPI003AF695B8